MRGAARRSTAGSQPQGSETGVRSVMLRTTPRLAWGATATVMGSTPTTARARMAPVRASSTYTRPGPRA